jgi:hypothetical protein
MGDDVDRPAYRQAIGFPLTLHVCHIDKILRNEQNSTAQAIDVFEVNAMLRLQNRTLLFENRQLKQAKAGRPNCKNRELLCKLQTSSFSLTG